MSATEEAPRRLTPTERLHEVTMTALARKPSEPESSVELSRNARGVTQISVTVRGVDPEECERTAVAIFERQRAKYPLPSGFVDAKGESK